MFMSASASAAAAAAKGRNTASARRPQGFQKGYDPNRNMSGGPLRGKSLAHAARQHTFAAVEYIASVARGIDDKTGEHKEYPVKDRLFACNCLLDRGHGKAQQNIEINNNDSAGIAVMSRDALLRIAAGAVAEDAEVIEAKPAEQKPLIEGTATRPRKPPEIRLEDIL